MCSAMDHPTLPSGKKNMSASSSRVRFIVLSTASWKYEFVLKYSNLRALLHLLCVANYRVPISNWIKNFSSKLRQQISFNQVAWK